MTTNPKTRTAVRTTLVRVGCCRPVACAPNVGVRCCSSPRCACLFPLQYGVAWRYAGDQAPTPGPERAPERARGALPAWAKPAGIAAGGAAGAGALGGIAWGVFEAVSWVVSHVILIGAGFAGIAFLFALLGGGRSRSGGTFSGTFRGRMD